MSRPKMNPEDRMFRICVTFRPDQREAVSQLQEKRMLSRVLQNAIDEYMKNGGE